MTFAASTYVHGWLYVMQFEQRLLGICPPSPIQTFMVEMNLSIGNPLGGPRRNDLHRTRHGSVSICTLGVREHVRQGTFLASADIARPLNPPLLESLRHGILAGEALVLSVKEIVLGRRHRGAVSYELDTNTGADVRLFRGTSGREEEARSVWRMSNRRPKGLAQAGAYTYTARVPKQIARTAPRSSTQQAENKP